ncbi:hypothetical protein BAUCODRAFT_183495 [Baudoinia panamericana UAMH 10762]|uniref:Uncharacterized protein n=1 Tax=Baudoinia panamericana (strain UAMH 10762) TaxID=717646 RepID=M2M180_BAUPA|nr:uncharacterized protein BAUCODRAFT_183495 [Baudoinia panamericana UAMH 10762]EMD00798.1 hypothetical protein BAUCODRAFT_183495 [Baudoinia panamericana UAMH 10762]
MIFRQGRISSFSPQLHCRSVAEGRTILDACSSIHRPSTMTAQSMQLLDLGEDTVDSLSVQTMLSASHMPSNATSCGILIDQSLPISQSCQETVASPAINEDQGYTTVTIMPSQAEHRAIKPYEELPASLDAVSVKLHLRRSRRIMLQQQRPRLWRRPRSHIYSLKEDHEAEKEAETAALLIPRVESSVLPE